MNFRIELVIVLSAVTILGGVGLLSWAQPNPEILARGKVIYDSHCAVCHGSDGKGDGRAARHMNPKPRDFTTGVFQSRSGSGGQLPTDSDLMSVINRGMGRSMPGFPSLSEDDLKALMQYVKHLSVYTTANGDRVNWFESAAQTGKSSEPTTVGADSPLPAAAIVQDGKVHPSARGGWRWRFGQKR
jgi:mono/diheme cytochrome c family protein